MWGGGRLGFLMTVWELGKGMDDLIFDQCLGLLPCAIVD